MIDGCECTCGTKCKDEILGIIQEFNDEYKFLTPQELYLLVQKIEQEVS